MFFLLNFVFNLINIVICFFFLVVIFNVWIIGELLFIWYNVCLIVSIFGLFVVLWIKLIIGWNDLKGWCNKILCLIVFLNIFFLLFKFWGGCGIRVGYIRCLYKGVSFLYKENKYVKFNGLFIIYIFLFFIFRILYNNVNIFLLMCFFLIFKCIVVFYLCFFNFFLIIFNKFFVFFLWIVKFVLCVIWKWVIDDIVYFVNNLWVKLLIMFFNKINLCFCFLFGKIMKCLSNEGICIIFNFVLFFFFVCFLLYKRVVKFKFLFNNIGNGWYVLIVIGVNIGKICLLKYFFINFCCFFVKLLNVKCLIFFNLSVGNI